MEKRYQIFVSSTFTDLIDERQAVSQALLSLNHFPSGMELFPASNEDQWTLIRGVIDDSDYYIIIIGGRYGSLTEQGVSFTEKEFDYAVTIGKSILAFLHSDPDKIPSGKTDKNDAAREKLEKLREKVSKGRTVKFWDSPQSLGLAVTQAVSAETKRRPAEGWIRGNQSSDPTRLNELSKQVEELKNALERARTLPPPGSENYAQGVEEYEIYFEYQVEYSSIPEHETVSMAWNDLFYEIGPVIMGEASERDMKRRLSEEIHMYVDGIVIKPRTLTISNDAFETIKVQFVALGLMKKSENKHAPSDRNIYWQITPYGEHVLMRLRAIKKGEKHPTIFADRKS